MVHVHIETFERPVDENEYDMTEEEGGGGRIQELKKLMGG
jgi:hypothetical protein